MGPPADFLHVLLRESTGIPSLGLGLALAFLPAGPAKRTMIKGDVGWGGVPPAERAGGVVGGVPVTCDLPEGGGGPPPSPNNQLLIYNNEATGRWFYSNRGMYLRLDAL